MNGLRLASERPTGISEMIPALNCFAADCLAQMYDPARKLFCHRVRSEDRALVREGISQRYTIMTLLGLHRFESAAGISPVAIAPVLGNLHADYSWIAGAGDMGLMLWITALASPERIDALCGSLEIASALNRLPDAQAGRTMELSWFLAGLSHAALALPHKRQSFERLAIDTYRLLKRNQGEHGFFGHLTTGSVVSRIRHHIGSFADQVYPIYAFSRFGQAFHAEEALLAAQLCAGAICKAQGPLGQWWWHYDARRGTTIQKYPVYSVHQDGMAPMALFALSEATGIDYNNHVYKGLAWISGNNELKLDLCDEAAKVIWRSIYPSSWSGKIGAVLRMFGSGEDQSRPRNLQILKECRPYHLGWLLYAFSGHTFGRAAIPIVTK